MGKLDQHTKPPLPDLSLDGSDQECPECGHAREVHRETWVDRLWVRFGWALGPAECDWLAAAMGDTCGCRNHFHGS